MKNKEKQAIPILHLLELTDEDERELVTSTLDVFAKANVPFCVVDNEEQDENVLCLHCFNGVPQKDIDEIRDEIFARYENIDVIAVTKMKFN